ncbi:fungal-specific transcription factor domain-containing protein [Mrakia frigida]|uniref:transcription factor domain-containing protein n=1 Tax=Mrakia frigida TaxID=29902 RepID=UPI003FCC0571
MQNHEELSPGSQLPPTSRRLTPTSLLAQTLQTNQSPSAPTNPGLPPLPLAPLPHPSALPPHLLMAGGHHPTFKSSSSAGSSSTIAAAPPAGTGTSSGGSGAGAGGGGSSAAGGSKKARPSKQVEEEDDQGDDEGGDGKKKRRRIERACFGCRQRRSKCDGGQPCTICTNNNAECSYPPPPRRVTIKYVEELEQKLASLESSSRTSSIPSGGRDSNGTPSIPSDSPSGPPYHSHPPPPLPHSSYPPSGSSSNRQDMGPPLQHPHQQYPYPQHIPFQSQPYPLQQQQQQPQQHQQYQHQQQNFYQDEDHPQRQEQQQHMQRNYPRPSLSSQPSNPYFNVVPPPQQPSTQFHHPQPFASTSSAPYPPSDHHVHQQHQPLPNVYQSSMPNASFSGNDPALSRTEDHGLVRPDTGEREFSPGESSEEEQDVAMEGVGRSGTGFESHPMVDRTRRWERQGQDGVSTELVENAAARLSGQVIKASRLHPTGQPEDAFVTQALALSPRSVANGLSASIVAKTGGESAVKGQTADVKNLQQRVFAKYDLPERKVADGLLAFYHEKVHPLYPILHWPSLMKKYEQIWMWPTEEHLIASDHIFLATLNILFCITCALRSGKDDNVSGGVYFRRSQTLMSVPFILLMGNVQIIDYLLLLCQYSQSCSKGNLSANAVGLAILMSRGLQLHIQKVNKTFGPLERNVRQRAWAACLQMEATSSAMLYRQTTSTDEDFDPSGFPEAFDDNDLGDNSIVARAETSSPKQIQFFIEVVKLFAIKCRILRSLYDLQNPKNFPHAHDVLVLEEQLLLWHQGVPDFLKDPSNTPADGPYKLQAHVLLNRYTNCRILLYRPFLFFVSSRCRSTSTSLLLTPRRPLLSQFCATPGGTYPIPDSLKFNLARKRFVVSFLVITSPVRKLINPSFLLPALSSVPKPPWS